MSGNCIREMAFLIAVISIVLIVKAVLMLKVKPAEKLGFPVEIH